MAETKASSAQLIYKSSKSNMEPAVRVTLILVAVAGVLGAAIIVGAVIGLFTTPFAFGLAPTLMFLIGALALAYAIFYWRYTLTQLHRQYELTLDDDEVTLIVEKSDNNRLIVRMPYRDIDFVEYFSARDNESLVFHSKVGNIIEVPLWAMDRNAESALRFLREHKLKLVTL